MAVTRINNNQITDAVQGNAYTGINANTKLQNYSITSTKIANNLTYGSDLTITGNLTVQGNSTAIDTTITTIEDPVIVLASTQTGAPAVDIGFIGERGTANNIAFVWNEANSQFVTAFTSTAETSTTISIIGYADLRTSNLTVGGTTSLIGNVIGAANFTGNVTGGNLRTPGLISATGGVTASSVAGGVITGTSSSVTGTQTAASTVGGVITGSSSSVTGTQTAASTVGGVITGSSSSLSGNVTGGNILTAGNVSATGNVIAAWLIGNIQGSFTSPGSNTQIIFNDSGIANATSGFTFNKTSNLVTVGGNVNATNFNGNVYGTTVSASGTVTAASTVGGVITGSSTSVTGTQTAASTVGGVITGSSSSVTGTQTAASTVGGVITGSSVSVSGTVTAATVNAATIGNAGATHNGTTFSASGTVTAASTVGGVITGSSTSVTGTQTAASTVGGVITGSSSSVTGTQTAASTVGGVITGSSTSVTGTQTAASTVGGVITGSTISTTGNVTVPNLVVSTNIYDANQMNLVTGAGNINLEPAGNIVINNTYINGLQLTPVQDQDAASKYYVDTIATTGITVHAAVYAATTTTLATTTGGTVTYAQPNGVANGIGATLTTTGSFNLIDTANVQTANTRILVKDQANAVQNGVYVWSNATVITRSLDTDQYGSDSANAFSINDYFFTTNGNVNAGTAFIVNAPTGTITFGTSNIGFGIFSQSQVYTANTSAGVSLNGTVFSAKVDNNTTAFDGSGNISVKAGANLTTPNIGAATGTSLSVTGTVTAASTVGGVITGSSSSVTGTQTAASTVGGVITGSSTSVTGTQTAASTVGGVITGSSVSITGTVTAATVNAATIGNAGATHNGTTFSASGTVTAASTVGGVITGSSTSVTGTQTAASTVGGVITGSSSSVTGTQTAASTVGGVITGTSTSVTGTVTAASVVGGVITGSSTSVTGTQTAASTVGGVITGSSASLSGNVTGGNILTGGLISAAGNITSNPASFFIGNGSQLTGVVASTSGFPVTAGTSNIAAATNGNIGVTVAGTSNVLTIASTGIFTTGLSSVTGNVIGGNINTGGIVSAAGNIVTGTSGFIGIRTSTPDVELNILATPQTVNYTLTGNSTTQGTDLHISGADGSNTRITQDAFGTGQYVAFTGRSARGTAASPTQTQSGDTIAQFTGRGFSNASLQFGNASTGRLDVVAAENFTDTSRATDVQIFTTASGAITPTAVAAFSSASGLSVTGAVTTSGNANIANATFFVNSSTSTASFGNSTQVTNALVTFNSTNSIKTPVGNTAQRPAVAVTGMFRFNTTLNNLEVYDNSAWTGVGTPVFTVIADQQFNGDGTTVAFTLSSTQTTNSCIVSINGVVQIPTLAYAVAGTDPTCVLTFTEAPATGDIIDVRQITTTTTVTYITNSSGNAVIAASATAGNVNITGNIMPTANATANIGSASFSYNTIFAKATSAQYADLAEKYVADAEYAPGTVVAFGGTHEVTLSTQDADRRVAGVVSTNPSYTMNSGLEGANIATVALTGRVPTSVTGTVTKGDLMVSNGNGTARAEADPKAGAIIGKALEDSEGDAVIEVVVGRF